MEYTDTSIEKKIQLIDVIYRRTRKLLIIELTRRTHVCTRLHPTKLEDTEILHA